MLLTENELIGSSAEADLYAISSYKFNKPQCTALLHCDWLNVQKAGAPECRKQLDWNGLNLSP